MSSTTINNFPSFRTWNRIISIYSVQILMRLFEEIHFMEQFFIRMQNVFAFTTQVIFFILVDFFLSDIQGDGVENVRSNNTVVMSLTTTLFYAVFGYFATRVRDVFLKHHINTVTLESSPNCLKIILRFLLEWAKSIVIILCIREQGIQYNPTKMYTISTLIYYLCSEKIFGDILSSIFENFELQVFENLEYLYVPLFMNSLTISMGSIVTVYLSIFHLSKFILISAYFLIYLRMKDAFFNYWKLIEAERKTYSSFRTATSDEITERDDVCAVCLGKMSKAKITPCNHLFHPICLKNCLKSSFLCPLCKYNFRQNL